MKTRHKRKGGRASLKYLIERFLPRNRTVSKPNGLVFKMRDTCKKKWWRPLNKAEECFIERKVPNLFQRLQSLNQIDVSDQFFMLKQVLSDEKFYKLDEKLIQDIQTLLGANLPLLLKAVFGEIVFDHSKVIVALMRNNMDFFVNIVSISKLGTEAKLGALKRLFKKSDLLDDFENLPIDKFSKRAILGLFMVSLGHRSLTEADNKLLSLWHTYQHPEEEPTEEEPTEQEPAPIDRLSDAEWSSVEKDPTEHTGENYFDREASADHPVRKMEIDVQNAALQLQKTLFDVEMIVFATTKKLSPDLLSDFDFLSSTFNADLSKIRLKTEVLHLILGYLNSLIYVNKSYTSEQIKLLKTLSAKANDVTQRVHMNNCITAYLDDPTTSLFLSFIPNIFLSIPGFETGISWMFPEIAQFNELGKVFQRNQFLFSSRKYIIHVLIELIVKVFTIRSETTPTGQTGVAYKKIIDAVLSKL